MQTNLLFRKYRARMLPEAILRALLYGCAAGAAAAFLLSLGYHFVCKELPVKLLLAICLPVCGLTFLLILWRLFPTNKRVAARLDETGLQERAGTMYAYRKENGTLVHLQREDAQQKIRDVKVSRLPSHLSWKEFILCGGCAALAAMMLMLPHDLFAVRSTAEADEDTKRQEQIVRELIDDLRDEVRTAELEREQQEELERLIEELEENLRKSETDLDRAAEINETERKIDETVDREVTRDELGEALERKELTKELGKAIREGDEDAVRQALSDLKETIKGDEEKLEQLKDELKEAAEESKVSKDNELRKALEKFSDQLAPEKEKMDKAFEDAEKEITEALEKQEQLEKEAEELKEALEKAKEELLGNEPEEAPSEAGQEGDSGEGEGTSGEGTSGEGDEASSGEGEEGEGEGEGEGETSGEGEGKQPGEGGDEGDPSTGPGGVGGGGGGPETMTEVFYDPISGKITYGEVFASYFSDYLKDKENGKIPADLQKIIDAYFESLME